MTKQKIFIILVVLIVVASFFVYKNHSVKLQEEKEINVIKQQQAKEEAILELEATQRKKEADANPKGYDDCMEMVRFEQIDKSVTLGLISVTDAMVGKGWISSQSDATESVNLTMDYRLTTGICKNLPIKTLKACSDVVNQAYKEMDILFAPAKEECFDRYWK